MIKFSSGEPGKKLLLGFGLSRANIDFLLSGKPILAKLDELGLESVEFFIFFGETEEAMKKDLDGFITERTVFKDSKKGEGFDETK